MHPALAALPCEVCKKYTHTDGVLERRRGKLIERRGPPPCATCPKIPPGAEPRPENAETLTPQNEQAYAHWLRCDAVNWQGVAESADDRVRHNAAVIRDVREQVRRELDWRWVAMMMARGRASGG